MRRGFVQAAALFFYALTMKNRYIFKNLNPKGMFVGDCVVRAVAEALETSWDRAYLGLIDYGFRMKNLPNANVVWGAFLYDHGFYKLPVTECYPDNCTIRRFCEEHPSGTFVVATGEHVVCCRDGCYIDSWDSGDEVPIYYFYRRSK